MVRRRLSLPLPPFSALNTHAHAHSLSLARMQAGCLARRGRPRGDPGRPVCRRARQDGAAAVPPGPKRDGPGHEATAVGHDGTRPGTLGGGGGGMGRCERVVVWDGKGGQRSNLSPSALHAYISLTSFILTPPPLISFSLPGQVSTAQEKSEQATCAEVVAGLLAAGCVGEPEEQQQAAPAAAGAAGGAAAGALQGGGGGFGGGGGGGPWLVCMLGRMMAGTTLEMSESWAVAVR
jgi:hypothetical protein